jgi:PHD/YefM family antitoxin component YafN of YafNO toxin-antitoxin module
MTITKLSSREFDQDPSRARKAALQGPVIRTDRGGPSRVLLSLAQYRKLTGDVMSLADGLAQPDIPGVDLDFEFDPPRA